MSINLTPVSSETSSRILNQSPAKLGRSLSRLAADARIVSTDSSASSAVSGKFVAQGKRVQAAMTSVQDAVSAVQVVDGYVGGMNEVIDRLHLAAASLQVESGNLASVVAPIGDEAGAGRSTSSAVSGVLSQPGLALMAQANLGADSAFRLLER